MNTIAKVVLAALLGLLGLTVVGVGQANAAGGPVLKSLSPTTGSANGGTAVTIGGSGFTGATAVKFGGATITTVCAPTPVAPCFTVNTGIKVTAYTPAALNGTANVNVAVTVGGVDSTPSSAGVNVYTYTWAAAPTVTAISPATGPATGGTSVTITGTNLGGASAVSFGGTPAASYTVVSATSITAVAPAGTGAVDVTVTTPNSQSATSNADVYNFLSTPTVTGIRTFANPAGGPTGGGTQVTIDGTSFSTGATVKFGSTAATSVLINSLSSITAVAPAGTGTVDVTVTTGLGTSAISSNDQFAYNSTLAIGTATGGYSSGASTTSGLAATATSFASGTTTVTSVGSWSKGEEVYLSGFTNGLAAGFYTVTAGGSGTFQISATSGASGTGTVVPSQANSFNAASVVTGGGTIDPTTLTVVTPPASGTESAVNGQLIYIPARTTPTSAIVSGATVWTQTVTTTGPQTATFALCTTGHTWTGPGSVGCATGTINYVEAGSGFYVGNQIVASGLHVSVVVDTGSAIVVPTSAAPNSIFTSVTAAPMANLPSTNSGFVVNSVGGYQAITPVPTGVTLVPGSLSVSGGDAASSGKYIASLCTAAMGFVAGECTAQSTGNFHLSYPYIETSLNAATTIAGGTQLTLPTVTAQWQVTASAGSTINSYETEFVVVTNVAPPIGTTTLDAYPSDLASFNNQGLGAPVPNYAAPSPRWSVPIANTGPVAPTITSADHATFVVGSAGTFTVTTSGNPTAAITKTGALPTGLTLVDNGDGTATIAGTPAAGTAGPYSITIKAANGTLPDASQSFTLTVDQAPAITSAAATTFTAGTAGTFTVTTTGTPNAAISTTSTLPSGVTLHDNGDGTATLAGTAAANAGGTYSLSIKASNGISPDATQAFTLTVHAAPAFTSATSTNFFENSAGTFTVTATGFPAPTFSETGALPSGVTFVNGVLSGTPASGSGGNYPIVITATNGISPDATQNPFTLHVLTTPVAPSITSVAHATFTVGTAGTFAVTGTGNPAPTFSVTSGSLPSGVTLASDGTLAGTPAAGTGGTHVVTITATNGVHPDATQSFTLTVDEAPAITSAGAVAFKTGVAGTFTATATGFPAPTFSEAGALPSGVTFVNGVLSGTPGATTGGIYPITITATNGIGTDATQGFNLTVDQPPAITSANSTTFTNGSPGLFNVTGTGFPTPTYTETGALPAGVTFVGGTLAGTPSESGIFSIVIHAAKWGQPRCLAELHADGSRAPGCTDGHVHLLE